MRTFGEFKYSLNFRLLVGRIASIEDLGAYRTLMVEKARDEAKTLGSAAVWSAAMGDDIVADALIDMKSSYIGMIEQDIMAIDAFLAQYAREHPSCR